jgi:hypothetical protein
MNWTLPERALLVNEICDSGSAFSAFFPGFMRKRTMETYAPKGTVYGPILPEFIMKRTLSLGAKITYAMLCDYAAFKNFCWPSHKTLAGRLGCSISSVKKYLAELADEKLVEIHPQDGHVSNKYFMLLPPELAQKAAKVIAFSHRPKERQTQTKIAETHTYFACPQANSDYRSNLNKQEEEKRNPPLPPVAARPTPPAQKQRMAGGGDSFSLDFEKAWTAYPKKEAEGLARHAWKQLGRIGALPSLDVILAAINRFASMEQWQRENGRFVPQMANWLRGERWKDPLTPVEEERVQRKKEIEAQVLREKEREKAENARNEHLRTLFRAFAVRFGPVKEHNAFACGMWMYLHGRGMAPSPDDVPENNSLGLVDFMKAFKAKREQEAWIAAHPEYATPPSVPVPLGQSKRENAAISCGDFLRAKELLQKLPSRQDYTLCEKDTLCEAV